MCDKVLLCTGLSIAVLNFEVASANLKISYVE